MRSHEFSFEVDATPDEVWRSLHPRLERGVIEHGDVRIEIVHPGDEHGVGLVRHCTFRVPRYLLSGGVGRSWEVVTESRPGEWSRYEAVGKPLWSRARGWKASYVSPKVTEVRPPPTLSMRCQPLARDQSGLPTAS